MAIPRRNVGFVELQPTFPNIGSFLICPTYGVIVLATILRDLGYSTSIMVEGMAKFSIEDLEDFDFICFSVKSASANKTYRMADKLQRRGKKVIFGGTHATFFPEDCLDHCDYVIRGEGDSVLPALLDCLENNIDPVSLKGLSYIKDAQAHHTEDMTPPTNLSTHSDYSLVNNIDHWGPVACLIRGRRMMLPVQSSRGCPHHCSFCIVNKMFGSSYRKRPVEAVIREIKSALRYTNNIHFVDNDFVGSSNLDLEHTAALLEAIIENNLQIKASVFVTIDVAKNEDLLKLMRRSGIQVLMIGFESVDQKSLACYHKNQEISEMEDSAKIIKDYGFTIMGSFMAGSSGEDDQTIIQTAHLSNRWGIDQLYYFVLSPYPEMAEIVSPQHVFLNNWDFATGNHIYFFPKNVAPSELQKAVLKANNIFYSLKRIMKLLLMFKFNSAKDLLLRRMLFKRIERPIKMKYLPLLRRIESSLYYDGKLNEKLVKNYKGDKFTYWCSDYNKT